MCGIGTTLVEAVHLGRNAAGVEYEPRWARLATANLTHAGIQGAAGDGRVFTEDARHIASSLNELHGREVLVVTSPPYGAFTHGQVRSTRDTGQHRYSHNRGNLAHRPVAELLAGFTEILYGYRQLLEPGGIAAITVRPIRVHGALLDLPSAVIQCGLDAGYTPVDRIACLLCAPRDGRLITRASFFQPLFHLIAMRGLRRVRHADCAGPTST